MTSTKCTLRILVLGGLFWVSVTGRLQSASIMEAEPNDSKAEANTAQLAHGETITGNSISSILAGPDYFKVTAAAAGAGINRHRLVLNSTTPGHIVSIRGLAQTDGVLDPASDTTAQISTPGPTVSQWYGSGIGSSTVYFRVTGSAQTVADYVATLSTELVTPIDLGEFKPGELTITTVGQTAVNTDLWIYDADLNAIAGFGNNDAPVDPPQSLLNRMYAPGIYYLAISTTNLANSLPSPPDDADRNGAVLDFSGPVLSSSRLPNQDVSFLILQPGQPPLFTAAATPDPFDIRWFRFTVLVPEPTTLALLGVGCLVVLLRRR